MRSAPVRALAWACLAYAVSTALLLSGRRANAQRAAPNVLLITLDTVRADRIGAYGYAGGATPTLDRLAREGVRFADATAQAPLTGPAHAALLTGQYPARLGVRDNASTPVPQGAATIAQLFKQKGYRTGGFVGAFILGPEYGFAQGFDTFDATFDRFDAGSKLQAQRRGGEIADAAVKWLQGGSSVEGSAPSKVEGTAPSKVEGPFFAWVHFYDAHTPYEPPAPFRARFAASPYDGEIAYVDSCVAKIVAALERSGQLDRTIVAVIADHGEGLGDHGEVEHGLFLYESVLHVPWIMRLPARQSAGSVVKAQVRAIDVAPTLAALGGVTMPNVDGQSVVPLIGGAAPRDPPPSYAETFYPKWHFGWSELKSVRVGDWKYIDAPKPELYDMRTDGGERRNAADARGPLSAGLSAELSRIQNTFGAAATAAPPQPDPEALARLRSLGYIGIAAPRAGARGADPKDMVAKLETFRAGISRAMDAIDRNAPDAAIAELTKLAPIDERSYELHLFLGDAYAAKREFDKSLGEYDAAALMYPQSVAPPLSQARVYLAMSDLPRAAGKVDAARQLAPSSGEVAAVYGSVLERQGRHAEALAAYKAAVRANGSDGRARASLASLALRLRQYDLAKLHFDKLLQTGYRPSRMNFGLGQIAEAQGDRDMAVALYRQSLRLEPSFSEARAALARLGVQP